MPTARQRVPVDTRAFTDSPTSGMATPNASLMNAAAHVPTLEA